MYVIRLTGLPADWDEPYAEMVTDDDAIIANDEAAVGYYLQAYDPDFNQGQGVVAWTPDAQHALRFETQAEARAFIARPSVRPTPDGIPQHRPITAFKLKIGPYTF